MKKRILFGIIALLALCGAMQAQNTKAARIKYIRDKYAWAKSEIANNGKYPNFDRSIVITLNEVLDVGEEFPEITNIKYFFKGNWKMSDDGSYKGGNQVYFISMDWSAYGHSTYEEILFDPKDGSLLFCFSHAETHAGQVIESRYYYGPNGELIESKQSGTNDWSSGDAEKKQANLFLSIFKELMSAEGASEKAQGGLVQTPSKAERLKFIRETYAKAKEKIAANDKSEVPRDMKIVIHDQQTADTPPVTTELKFYFDEVVDQVETDAVSIDNYCYFISEHRHSMMFNSYYEYLYAPKSQNMIFSYCRWLEEGEVYESRYYYDEKGRCIEAKTNLEDVDYGANDKSSAKHFMNVFNALANQ